MALWPWQVGFYEYGLALLLSRSFLRICMLFFSGTQEGVRALCGILHEKAWFFENNILPQMEQVGQTLGSQNV